MNVVQGQETTELELVRPADSDSAITQDAIDINQSYTVLAKTNRTTAPEILIVSDGIEYKLLPSTGTNYLYQLIPNNTGIYNLSFYYQDNEDYSGVVQPFELTVTKLPSELYNDSNLEHTAYVVLQRERGHNWHLSLMLNVNGDTILDNKVKVEQDLKDIIKQKAEALIVQEAENNEL